jgi:hypothetical protein
MFVWLRSFVDRKQTAMQPNPLHEQAEAILKVFEGKIDLDNLIPTCIFMAQKIEMIAGLAGKEKLEMLQRVLRITVGKSDKSADEKSELVNMIDTVIPMVVQAAVLASKSPILGQVQATCVGCWTKK